MVILKMGLVLKIISLCLVVNTLLSTSFTWAAAPLPVAPLSNRNIPVEQTVTYAWQPVPQAATYDFFVYDRTLPGIKFRNANLTASSVCNSYLCQYTPPSQALLPVGERHVWRVAAIGNSGASDFSYSRFNVVPAQAPPPVPIAVYPASTSNITFGQTTTYSWQPVPQATGYDFFVYDRNLPGMKFRNANLTASSVCNSYLCQYTPLS